MDLRFTPEENAFCDEVRTFIKQNLPPHIRAKAAEGIRYVKDDIVTWQRILNQKGWAVPHWPKEWGGTGWSPVQLYIFREELQQAPAPEPLPFGALMVGPVIIAFGREDQKRMQEAGDAFFDGVHVDTYASSSGKTRGVRVRSIDPKLAAKFGIGQGEVLFEINGKKVESRGQAIQTARKDYNRGVRTFVTKWLVNGAVVERTIQAPTEK